MKIFDINPKHKLALVELPEVDGRGFKIAYVPLTEEIAG
jgi:hypothetical protein